MKNKHLLLVWEDFPTTRRNIDQKVAKFYEDFFCNFYINEFHSVSH